MVSTMMEQRSQKINYDTMLSYEKMSGLKGLGIFLENMGVITLIRGESCSKK